eukprot:scaffold26571_cov52-Attheya_sp.AAC.8
MALVQRSTPPPPHDVHMQLRTTPAKTRPVLSSRQSSALPSTASLYRTRPMGFSCLGNMEPRPSVGTPLGLEQLGRHLPVPASS